MSRFSDRVAIVTGAAQGIGRATALRLASEGARVAAVDVDAARVAPVVESIEAAGVSLGIVGAMVVASAPTKPGTTGQRESDPVDVTASPWVTIVWDDPVNLMTYVTYVFQKLFGYSEPHATKLMLQVHNEGKAVVSAGSRESMEVDVSKLHAAGLWATLQQDR